MMLKRTIPDKNNTALRLCFKKRFNFRLDRLPELLLSWLSMVFKMGFGMYANSAIFDGYYKSRQVIDEVQGENVSIKY
jgi:hypothetical protein